MAKIDEVIYNEIKEAKKDGLNSKDCAEEMELELAEVNKVFASDTYEDYAEIPIKSKSLEIKKPKHDIAPLQKGYFRSLIERRKEENVGLKEMHEALGATVKGLWGMIDLLQARKTQLENDIKFMENYIRRGSAMIENYVEDEQQ